MNRAPLPGMIKGYALQAMAHGADTVVHFIAMAAAVAAAGCREPVHIRGAQCVAKSYPDFFEDYRKAGGVVHVL